jgi:hypothetical protein
MSHLEKNVTQQQNMSEIVTSQSNTVTHACYVVYEISELQLFSGKEIIKQCLQM